MQAGRMLANQLVPKYRYENCAVLALSDGGVIIGAQIASQLHCVLNMLMIEEIKLPSEPDTVGGVLADGAFNYNHDYSEGEIDEINSEFRNYLEQEKMSKFHRLNMAVGSTGTADKSMLREHNVIIVSDGLNSSFTLDMAMDYLKPIHTARIIIATPLASVKAIDKMHVSADEIYCLDVLDNFMDINHYYDANDVPNHETIIRTIEQIVLNWK